VWLSDPAPGNIQAELITSLCSTIAWHPHHKVQISLLDRENHYQITVWNNTRCWLRQHVTCEAALWSHLWFFRRYLWKLGYGHLVLNTELLQIKQVITWDIKWRQWEHYFIPHNCRIEVVFVYNAPLLLWCCMHVMKPTWCTIYLQFIQSLYLYMFRAC
jgi:hypothetical protein